MRGSSLERRRTVAGVHGRCTADKAETNLVDAVQCRIGARRSRVFYQAEYYLGQEVGEFLALVEHSYLKYVTMEYAFSARDERRRRRLHSQTLRRPLHVCLGWSFGRRRKLVFHCPLLPPVLRLSAAVSGVIVFMYIPVLFSKPAQIASLG